MSCNSQLGATNVGAGYLPPQLHDPNQTKTRNSLASLSSVGADEHPLQFLHFPAPLNPQFSFMYTNSSNPSAYSQAIAPGDPRHIGSKIHAKYQTSLSEYDAKMWLDRSVTAFDNYLRDHPVIPDSPYSYVVMSQEWFDEAVSDPFPTFCQAAQAVMFETRKKTRAVLRHLQLANRPLFLRLLRTIPTHERFTDLADTITESAASTMSRILNCETRYFFLRHNHQITSVLSSGHICLMNRHQLHHQTHKNKQTN
jgi:hypothetical protein